MPVFSALARHTLRAVLSLVLLILGLCVPATSAADIGRFRLTLDPAQQPVPYTGRLYVALADAESRGEPRTQMGDWMGGTQVFTFDVTNLKPGEPVIIGPDAAGFPKAFAQAAAGNFKVQAIARRALDSCSPGTSANDLVSAALVADFKPDADGVLDLKLDTVVKPRAFRETGRVKLVEFESPSLSKFLGRPFTFRAGVMLPESWSADGSDQFSVVYFISGFGDTHHSIHGIGRMIAANPQAKRTIIVLPDPTCFRGHSVFADSANNGPWGTAFVEELLPEIEKRFRAAPDRERRFVTGISSGGWSALWLAVTYPSAFAGCWAHCPDPVDFRDFQRIDLYAPKANMYRDDEGKRRPLMRQGEQVMLHYDDFVRQETVMGPGGQIHSFEAVFSPRENEQPRPLFDRATGTVDPVTAKAWELFDIRLVLERNWDILGPELKGRLRVYAGAEDNFYLEGAVRRLKTTLDALPESAATVEIIEGMPHTIASQGMADMLSAIEKAEASARP